jgi:tRNA A-37 threonylcarbamoyl transferase component Bud32
MAARYRIEKEIGRGAMGRVYLAHDALLDRDVALKELATPAYLSGEEREEVRGRFRHEAQAAARLTHPHILTVHDIVSSGDRQFIVMEYLEGKTLRQILAERTFSAEELLSIAPMVSEALDYAHSQGIIHRDIKPDNIFVLESGNIKVADFGIAKMLKVSDQAHTDVIMGTPNYIAPELVKGMAYDYRVDIFSLGVTLYELLAGRRPFDADNDYAIIYKVASEEPVPLAEVRNDLPPDLVRVINRSLEKDPGRRYPNMKEVKEDLMKVRAELGMSTAREKESFDKEKALQSELEKARGLDDAKPVEDESPGGFDFRRDREWKELIARVYHKGPEGHDIALTAAKRARWEELEAMARDGTPPSRAPAGGTARMFAVESGGAAPVRGYQAAYRPGAATPGRHTKLADPTGTMRWSTVAITAGVLVVLSVMLPWIGGSLHPSRNLFGVTFPEGMAVVVLTALVLCADALLLLGVGEPRIWVRTMKGLSFFGLLVVLLFFGLRIFAGIGYEQMVGIGALDYVKGVGWGLWLALVCSAVTYWTCRRAGRAAL